MATLINRSHYIVSVGKRRDHKREFSYDKESEARAYLESLRAQGLVELIAKGYRLMAVAIIAIFILPLCTIGIAKLKRIRYTGSRRWR